MRCEHVKRCRLIIDSDLDLFLWRRNDFVFLLARKGWELFERLLDDIKSTLDLGFRDDQWRCKTNDVLVGWLGLYHLGLAFCFANPAEKRGKHTSNPLVFINMHRSQAE